ncbi:MAG: peptidase domain-containing ABC transporter [Cyanobacteria bacterium P01_A01_bin.84]
MNNTKASIQTSIPDILREIFPFNQLPETELTSLATKFEILRYRMGQTILAREYMPAHVSILYEGQARMLAYDRRSETLIPLHLIQKGELFGWSSWLRGIPCEQVIASGETICLNLSISDFLELMEKFPEFAHGFRAQPSAIELFELLSEQLGQRPDSETILDFNGVSDIAGFTFKLLPNVFIYHLPLGTSPIAHLDPDFAWLVSGGEIKDFPIASHIPVQERKRQKSLEVIGNDYARLLGIPLIEFTWDSPVEIVAAVSRVTSDVPYAPERPPQLETDLEDNQKTTKYPFVGARSPVKATLACFQMLSQYWNISFRRDVIQKLLNNQVQRTQTLSLQLCGSIAELMGLNAHLIRIKAVAITKIEAPAMIRWQDSFAILYEISEKKLVLAVPEVGIIQQTPNTFLETWGEEGQVLLLKQTSHTPRKKFGLSWFVPSLVKYRKVLIEVLLASFAVQIFGLANPLIIQLIIDKVIINNSYSTLNIFGSLLLTLAVFEGIFNNIRTYLFVDTTNRIDLALGSEIIDHLLRLPLRYFERRPVGELASRANELENIRSFLTGTALTVVLDAIFSVIYIAVMLAYSWQLTLVALATIPLFALLTIVVSPIVRRQLRTKAEKNAQTQSYLVEVLSGMLTVKAQNLELRSRWRWQERYANYVSAGFKTVATSTTAGSLSNFLNQLSGLLVLWVGAYLVLQQQLTLGQIIAFRIIASYVTAPLLRLTQLWQNFQETALSLERLGDILDTPAEADTSERNNISMPIIKGAVKYENVSFRFNPNGPQQLKNINLEFSPGQFVGIVGQSGSGKSTLTKLIPRLYPQESGRILIDGYDISKTELYSLRRQIGVVLQDTLLFEGSIAENIALTNPDSTTEEIVEAAKIAAAHEFIMSLPHGYNTHVGERGSGLSGGQRQRIAIARTVLQNPRLLILDEATSALDYQSERQVCSNLAGAFQDKTVFFITHRLSTVKNADVILMLENGTVVEKGRHEELMSQKGRYYCLYQQQETQN